MEATPKMTKHPDNPPREPQSSAGQAQRARAEAFWLLRGGFTIAPILFGADKFARWAGLLDERRSRGASSRATSRPAGVSLVMV